MEQLAITLLDGLTGNAGWLVVGFLAFVMATPLPGGWMDRNVITPIRTRMDERRAADAIEITIEDLELGFEIIETEPEYKTPEVFVMAIGMGQRVAEVVEEIVETVIETIKVVVATVKKAAVAVAVTVVNTKTARAATQLLGYLRKRYDHAFRRRPTVRRPLHALAARQPRIHPQGYGERYWPTGALHHQLPNQAW